MNNKMLYPQGKPKALTFSYDDGEKRDIRLCELFNKYGLKGTFNLNSGLMPLQPDEKSDKVALSQIPEIYAGHEVAVHSLTHPFLERMSPSLVAREILEDKKLLEEYTGYIVRGMAYPFGTYNDDVIRVCKDIGIKYSRNVGAHHKFTLPKKWLEWDSTCHQKDPETLNIAKKFVEGKPFDDWGCIEGWLCYIWGHSFEYRTEEDWTRFEEICQVLSGRDDIWYATNIELYNYIEAYRSLEYSVDCTRVYNPSAYDIWMIANGKQVVIPSGEEIAL